jgi:tRNA G26 N,N-dimethylase Trm1
VSREARRRGSRRARRREALEAIEKMVRLDQQGFSPKAIASGVPVSEGAVEKILGTLKEAGADAHLPEAQKESVGVGGRGS